MTIYNHYQFKHIDEDTTYMVSFNADMGDQVIDTFVTFMSGCGFSDDFIYSHMSEVSELYFEVQEKKQKLVKTDLEE